jgi:uncharacterized damage-inducible protein DinB
MEVVKNALDKMFDYDLWANRRWVNAVHHFKDQERVVDILRHILTAQRIWLERLDRQENASSNVDMLDNLPLQEAFEKSSSDWKQFLANHDLDWILRYTRDNGIEYAIPLADVARHVLNHGTYHRGHLRGLAEAEGLTEFDDTDYAIFARTPGPDDL